MKVILFDFFGVLSTPVYMQVIKKFIPEPEHREWIQKLDILDIGDLTESELVTQIAARGGVPEDEVWKTANAAPKVNWELFDFIEKKLKSEYTVGLLTNIPRNLLERIVPDTLGLFDIALVSSDLKMIKPNREIFETAIQACACSPNEILFIDDSAKNIEVARGLGMNGIVYTDLPSALLEMQRYLVVK